MCRAIDSVINQTYKNTEIILVNDGSTDRTLKICKDYSCRYQNIKVISKENGGVSSSRNIGLSQAEGEYIHFLDCDDFIDKDLYEKVINNDNGFDIIQFGVKCVRENNIVKSVSAIDCELKNGIQDWDELEKWMPLLASVYSKIYKKSCIKTVFDESMKYAEDMYFNLSLLNKNLKIKMQSDCFYTVYLDNNDSLNRGYQKGRLSCIGKFIKKEDEVFSNILGQAYKSEKIMFSGTRTLLNAVEMCAGKRDKNFFIEEIRESSFDENIEFVLSNNIVDSFYRTPEIWMMNKKCFNILYTYAKIIWRLKNIKRKIKK